MNPIRSPKLELLSARCPNSRSTSDVRRRPATRPPRPAGSSSRRTGTPARRSRRTRWTPRPPRGPARGRPATGPARRLRGAVVEVRDQAEARRHQVIVRGGAAGGVEPVVAEPQVAGGAGDAAAGAGPGPAVAEHQERLAEFVGRAVQVEPPGPGRGDGRQEQHARSSLPVSAWSESDPPRHPGQMTHLVHRDRHVHGLGGQVEPDGHGRVGDAVAVLVHDVSGGEDVSAGVEEGAGPQPVGGQYLDDAAERAVSANGASANAPTTGARRSSSDSIRRRGRDKVRLRLRPAGEAIPLNPCGAGKLRADRGRTGTRRPCPSGY